MNSDVIVRLGMALAIIALGIGAYWGWNRWQMHRLGRAAAARLPGLEGMRPGAAAVLYFTTPDCAPCRTTQRPALERLQADLGERVQVIEVDASAHPHVADHWGVLSVPTTFIIDASGQPRRVNHGVTSREKLARQINDLAGVSPGRPVVQLESSEELI